MRAQLGTNLPCVYPARGGRTTDLYEVGMGDEIVPSSARVKD